MSLDRLSSNLSLANGITVLAPAGAEYKAVKKGMQRVVDSCSNIVAVPAGEAIAHFVKSLSEENKLQPNVLLMGLGGGLARSETVGRSHLLTKVWNAADSQVSVCDESLTRLLYCHLEDVALSEGITCKQIVTKVNDKSALCDRYQAQIVDMESFFLLQSLTYLPQYKVAVLRVVSDACDYDLPDISQAIRPNGSLSTANLAISFAKKPIAAVRFVRSSLRGLNRLEKVAERLAEKMR